MRPKAIQYAYANTYQRVMIVDKIKCMSFKVKIPIKIIHVIYYPSASRMRIKLSRFLYVRDLPYVYPLHITYNDLDVFLLLVAMSIISSESQMANRPKRLTQYFNDTIIAAATTVANTILPCLLFSVYTYRIFHDDVRQARKLSFNRLVIMLH